MATSAQGTFTGKVEAVGTTAEDPALHDQHAEGSTGTTPAPDATPEGAVAYFLGDDGSDAWLATDTTGTEAPAAPENASPNDGTTPDATANTGSAAAPAPAPDAQSLVGYLRRANAEPVRYDSVQRWVSDVDSLQMHEAPVPQAEGQQQPAGAAPGDPAAQPTAPAAPAGPAPTPAVKGKMPPQFAGHQFGSGGSKPSGGGNPLQDAGNGKPPAIDRGSFVQLGNVRGRVDLIVTSGKVPGVDGDVEGTFQSPAARVVVWEPDGSGYKPSNRKIGASIARLKRIPPLQSGGSKALETIEDLHALHEAAIEAKDLPVTASVGPDSVTAAFERGVRAWPGYEKAGCGPEEWGVARVEALLAKAAGWGPDGYVRDDDLLTQPGR